MKAQFLFHTWPYAALIVLVVGFIARVFLPRGRPVSGDEASRGRKVFTRAAWVVLVGGHVLAFVVPSVVLSWNASPGRLYLLEAVGFVAGAAVLVAWALSSWRRFTRRASVAAEVTDSAFLATLFVGVLSGLLIAFRYRWASSWGAATLAPYVASISTGAPATELVEQMPFWVQLHVFTAFAALAVLPFTSYAPLAITAVQRSLVFATRPVSRPVLAWMRKREAARERASAAEVPRQVQTSGVRATAGIQETVPVARETASKN